MNGNRVVVLIDYENVLTLFRKKVLKGGQIDWRQVVATARRFGSVLISKAYADWEGNLTVRKRILSLGIEPVTVPKSPNCKNCVDVKIAVDAIDLTVVRNPDIRTVVLVSGDGDFTPLVNYLKNQGKYIVGMGIRESTAEFLESSCNEFVYLVKDNREPAQVPDFPSDAAETPAAARTVRVSETPARPSAAEPGTVVDLGEARELLRRSMEQADGEWVGGSTLKSKMLALMPGFNEDRYGYGRFIDFLQAQADIVESRTHAPGNHLEIRLRRGGAPAAACAPADPLTVEGYIAILRKGGIDIRPSEHRPLIVREAYEHLRANRELTFLQLRDEMLGLFKKKHPQVVVRFVLDTVYQVMQASCLEWELACGRFPSDTPLHVRKCWLSALVTSADELLRKVDAHLLSVIAAGVKPGAVDAAAATHVLYGREANGGKAAYITGLLEALPASPSSS
jgi:uncharacterized protein (TIGR00288 family)